MDEKIYIDGRFNLSYGELLYGQKVKCKECKKRQCEAGMIEGICHFCRKRISNLKDADNTLK